MASCLPAGTHGGADPSRSLAWRRIAPESCDDPGMAAGNRRRPGAARRRSVAAALGCCLLATVTASAARGEAGAQERVRFAASVSRCPDTGICVVESRRRYRVEARSDASLVDAVADGADGRSAHAITDFGITLSYELHPVGGRDSDRCRLDRIALRLEVDMLLPRLVDSVLASAERRTSWRRSREGLGRHERGHVDIAVEYAQRLVARLRKLPTDDCRALRLAAGREHMRQSMRHALAQQLYDSRTGSGARQGAVLALPAPRPPQPLQWR